MNSIRKLSISLLVILLAACSSNKVSLKTYSATNNNEHAIEVDGEEISYENIEVTKSGDGEGESADFYGENAAVFASNGANLTIKNASIVSDGQYGNAVFSYGEGTIVTISDSTIKTSQRNSGGIMVTGGGTLYANNLTVDTDGDSSAAIRSDRGGGSIVVDGGSYTANGKGSPAIYSTADIKVSNASLNATSAQGVVVEGGNSVELNNCSVVANNTSKNSENSDYYQAVMLYQSMSGDAAMGSGDFKMSGGSLSSLNEGMFFVTNATYAISLNNVALTYVSDDLLRICAAGWGSQGNNGGQVTFNLDNQKIEGVISVDEISKLNMYLKNNSEFVGAFDNNGEVYVQIEEGSSWSLTGDSSISSLTCEKDSIKLNGYTLLVNGEKYIEGSECTGDQIEFTISQMGDFMGQPTGDMNNPPQMPNGEMGNGPMGDGTTPPEKPDGEMGNGMNPPQMPSGEMNKGQQPPNMGNGNSEPPQKPEENNKQN